MQPIQPISTQVGCIGNTGSLAIYTDHHRILIFSLPRLGTYESLQRSTFQLHLYYIEKDVLWL